MFDGPSSLRSAHHDGDLVDPGTGESQRQFFAPLQKRLSVDSVFVLAEHAHKDQGSAKRFIRQRFSATYGARINRFMPRLLTLGSNCVEVAGAFGLRPATTPLYLERYLDKPVEVMIAKAVGRDVARQDIIEVGHFSGTRAGVARVMIAELTMRLHDEGFKWVAFTGTTRLRNAFYRLGLKPCDLAPADPMRLDSVERSLWGSYYRQMPRVYFGDIAQGRAALIHHRRTGDFPERAYRA